MSNRSIASTTFDSWHGSFLTPRVNVTTFVRSGRPGIGAFNSASQPQRVEITASIIGDLADCETYKETLEALSGTFVTATDDRGYTYDHTLVEFITCDVAPCIGDAESILTCHAALWPGDSP